MAAKNKERQDHFFSVDMPSYKTEAWTYYDACYLPGVSYPLSCLSLLEATGHDPTEGNVHFHAAVSIDTRARKFCMVHKT